MATQVENHTLGRITLSWRRLRGSRRKIFLSELSGLDKESRQKILKTASQSKGVRDARLDSEENLICRFHARLKNVDELTKKLLNRVASKVERIRKLAKRQTHNSLRGERYRSPRQGRGQLATARAT